MRKLFTPLLALFILVSLGSCDKIKELADVDFDANLETPNMTISPPLGKNIRTSGYEFLVSNKINPLGNSDIEKYLNKIKKWDINSIEVEVISVSESNTYLKAGTKLEMKSSKHSAMSTFEEDTPIFAGYKYKVPSSVHSQVEAILNDKEEFDVDFMGGLNNDATVIMKVKIDVTITANPL